MNPIAAFDEKRFQPSSACAHDYIARVKAGYKRMRGENVIITGLARNLAGVIDVTAARLEALGELFRDYRIFIYENDSKDDTAERLNRWARHKRRITIQSQTRDDPVNPGTRCLQRAARMAYYRNCCRRYIIDAIVAEPTFGYVIVADLDLRGGWSYDGLANTFSYVHWDAMGSNGILYKNRNTRSGRYVHYDVWAFRWHGNWTPCQPAEIGPLSWPRGAEPIRLNSCFGGLGVYRSDAVLESEYSGEDCEHVPFHRRMAEAGFNRLYLNPSQFVIY